jgi:hypothetical protein
MRYRIQNQKGNIWKIREHLCNLAVHKRIVSIISLRTSFLFLITVYCYLNSETRNIYTNFKYFTKGIAIRTDGGRSTADKPRVSFYEPRPLGLCTICIIYFEVVLTNTFQEFKEC